MKVLKHQLDKGLQKTYRMGMITSWLLSKVWGIKLFHKLARIGVGKDVDGLRCEETHIPSRNNGPDIRLRIYRPADENPEKKLPVLLYIHGGGYVLGCPEMFGTHIKRYIDTRPCIVISPDYRKALEAPFPAGFNDCYDTLLWARDNADLLNADMSKVMLGGHSAGGGISAALTWKARDTGDVNVGFQMPIYPMIDDRHITESAHLNTPVWNSSSNKLAWKLYLGDVDSSENEVPNYAAPSRNTNYENFPPSFTFVGDLEPFKDETIAYVEALRSNGATVEFKIFKGCFHAFDGMNASISEEASDFTYNTYARFYDEYIA